MWIFRLVRAFVQYLWSHRPGAASRAAASDIKAIVDGILDAHMVRPSGGEKYLFAAVLRDAMTRYLQGLSAKSRNALLESRQARAWLALEDWEWPFSCTNTCDVLGIQQAAILADLVHATKELERRAAA